MDLNSVGLWLNFLGALFLAVGTSIQTEHIMNHLKSTMNYTGSPGGMIKNAVQKNIRALKMMKIGGYIIYAGYGLFIIGFGLQLVH